MTEPAAAAPPGQGAPAPEDLREHGLQLWETIAPHYILRPDELQVLADACRLTDQAALLDDVVAELGLMVQTSQGQSVNPAVAEARRTRQAVGVALRSLRLPELKGSGKTTSEQAVAAARARWDNRRSG